MNLTTLGRSVAKSLSERSPLILTGMAVTGLATTVYLALKAKPIADQKVFDASYSDDTGELKDLSWQEKVSLVWTDYAPAVVMGVVTAGCIVGIHSVHSRRSAALMSVYSLTETAFKEYQAKVAETIGENKESKIRDEIAKDRLEANPPKDGQIIVTGGGEQLCYDMYSGRYFRSDIEKIRKAQNDLNQEALQNFYVPLNAFYAAIGLQETRVGDEVGFNSEHLMDLRFTSHLNDEGVACLAIDHNESPSRDYSRFH